MDNPIVFLIRKKKNNIYLKLKITTTLFFSILLLYFLYKNIIVDRSEDIESLLKLMIFYLFAYICGFLVNIIFTNINYNINGYKINNCPLLFIEHPFIYFFVKKFRILSSIIILLVSILIILLGLYGVGLGFAVLITANWNDKKFAILMFLIWLPFIFFSVKNIFFLRKIRRKITMTN